MSSSEKIKKTLWILILFYVSLVATHRGEFWPMSIFPMFSQTNITWEKVFVQIVENFEFNENQYSYDLGSLPGKPFRLDNTSISQNDLSNYIQRTENWDKGEIMHIRNYFKDYLAEQDLLIIQAKNVLENRKEEFKIKYHPYIYLSSDTTIINR